MFIYLNKHSKLDRNDRPHLITLLLGDYMTIVTPNGDLDVQLLI